MITDGLMDGHGYVTDLRYPAGYYREQAPTHMHLACLLAGDAGIDCTQRLTYLELGCGTGFGATVLATSNPHWQVVGVDLMLEHVRAASDLAKQAGVTNVHFLQGDLATFAETGAAQDLPMADIVSLHGLWSWVPQPVRDGVVRLIAAKLKPSGLAQVAYNSLPGWQSAIGMQHVVRQFGLSHAGSSAEQAMAGLRTVFDLIGAHSMHLGPQPFVQAMLHALSTSSVDYLAHEYMNASWSPVFHSDLCRALEPAGLRFVASANVMENLPDLTLTDRQRAVFDAAATVEQRELIKDMCLFRGFRNDIFRRGHAPLSETEQQKMLANQLVMACRESSAFPQTIFIPRPSVPRTPIALSQDQYGPIATALDAGPMRIGALAQLSSSAAFKLEDLAAVLVGSNHVVPVAGMPTLEDTVAVRLNRLIADLAKQPDNSKAGLALATTGSSTPIPRKAADLT